MKIGNELRSELFFQGRDVNPMLGDLFQNQMDMSSEHVDLELEAINRIRDQIDEYEARVMNLKKELVE